MGNVANATAIQGHVENRLFDCRPAAMVTVRDEKRLRWTGRILTAGPWFPLGGSPMLNHVCVLTSGTINLEVGHGDLHDSVRTAFWRLLRWRSVCARTWELPSRREAILSWSRKSSSPPGAWRIRRQECGFSACRSLVWPQRAG